MNGSLHLIGMVLSTHSVDCQLVAKLTHHSDLVIQQPLIILRVEEQTFNLKVGSKFASHHHILVKVTSTLVLMILLITPLVYVHLVVDLLDQFMVLVQNLEFMLHTQEKEDFMASMVQSKLHWLQLLPKEPSRFLVQHISYPQIITMVWVLYQHYQVLQNLLHSAQTKSRCSSPSWAEEFPRRQLSGKSARVELLLYLEQESRQLQLQNSRRCCYSIWYCNRENCSSVRWYWKYFHSIRCSRSSYLQPR